VKTFNGLLYTFKDQLFYRLNWYVLRAADTDASF